ncbi:MAG: HYExAFE family protein, partial [Planctomycetota bacterium]
DDVECLLQWETIFGAESRAILAFAYDLADGESADEQEPFAWGGRRYAFFAVTVADYATAMTARSASWATVHLPRADFRRLRVPFDELL